MSGRLTLPLSEIDVHWVESPYNCSKAVEKNTPLIIQTMKKLSIECLVSFKFADSTFFLITHRWLSMFF